MDRKLYCIRDTLVGYGAPLVDISDESAVRNFKFALANTPELAFKANDLDLFYLGTLDSESGTLKGESIPKIIIRGAEVMTSLSAMKEGEK